MQSDTSYMCSYMYAKMFYINSLDVYLFPTDVRNVTHTESHRYKPRIKGSLAQGLRAS